MVYIFLLYLKYDFNLKTKNDLENKKLSSNKKYWCDF